MPVETIEAKELWTPAGDYSRRFIVKATDPHEAIVAAKAKTKKGWTFVSANATQAGMAMWEVEVQYAKDDQSSPTPVTDAFRELAQASGGRWDNVDPEAFVRELRGPTDQPGEAGE